MKKKRNYGQKSIVSTMSILMAMGMVSPTAAIHAASDFGISTTDYQILLNDGKGFRSWNVNVNGDGKYSGTISLTTSDYELTGALQLEFKTLEDVEGFTLINENSDAHIAIAKLNVEGKTAEEISDYLNTKLYLYGDSIDTDTVYDLVKLQAVLSENTYTEPQKEEPSEAIAEQTMIQPTSMMSYAASSIVQPNIKTTLNEILLSNLQDNQCYAILYHTVDNPNKPTEIKWYTKSEIEANNPFVGLKSDSLYYVKTKLIGAPDNDSEDTYTYTQVLIEGQILSNDLPVTVTLKSWNKEDAVYEFITDENGFFQCAVDTDTTYMIEARSANGYEYHEANHYDNYKGGVFDLTKYVTNYKDAKDFVDSHYTVNGNIITEVNNETLGFILDAYDYRLSSDEKQEIDQILKAAGSKLTYEELYKEATSKVDAERDAFLAKYVGKEEDSGTTLGKKYNIGRRYQIILDDAEKDWEGLHYKVKEEIDSLLNMMQISNVRSYSELMVAAHYYEEASDNFIKTYFSDENGAFSNVTGDNVDTILSAKKTAESKNAFKDYGSSNSYQLLAAINVNLNGKTNTTYDALYAEANGIKVVVDDFIANYLTEDRNLVTSVTQKNIEGIVKGEAAWLKLSSKQQNYLNKKLKTAGNITYESLLDEAKNIDKQADLFLDTYMKENGAFIKDIDRFNYKKVASAEEDWENASDVLKEAIESRYDYIDDVIKTAVKYQGYFEEFINPYLVDDQNALFKTVNGDNYQQILNAHKVWNNYSYYEKDEINEIMAKESGVSYYELYDKAISYQNDLKKEQEFIKQYLTYEDKLVTFVDEHTILNLKEGEEEWEKLSKESQDDIDQQLDVAKKGTTFKGLIKEADQIIGVLEDFANKYLMKNNSWIETIRFDNYEKVIESKTTWDTFDATTKAVLDLFQKKSYEELYQSAVNYQTKIQKFVEEYLTDENGIIKEVTQKNYISIINGKTAYDELNTDERAAVNAKLKTVSYDALYKTACSWEKVYGFIKKYISDDEGNYFIAVTAGNYKQILSGNEYPSEWESLTETQRNQIDELTQYTALFTVAQEMKDNVKVFIDGHGGNKKLKKANKDTYIYILEGEPAWNALSDECKKAVNQELPTAYQVLLSQAHELKDGSAAFVKNYVTGADGVVYKNVTKANQTQIISGYTTWEKMSSDQQDIIDELLIQAGSKPYEQLIEDTKDLAQRVNNFIKKYAMDDAGNYIKEPTADNYEHITSSLVAWNGLGKEGQSTVDEILTEKNDLSFTKLLSDAHAFEQHVQDFMNEHHKNADKAITKDNYKTVLSAKDAWSALSSEEQKAVNKSLNAKGGKNFDILLQEATSLMDTAKIFTDTFVFETATVKNYAIINLGYQNFSKMDELQQYVITNEVKEIIQKDYANLVSDAQQIEKKINTFIREFAADQDNAVYAAVTADNCKSILLGKQQWEQIGSDYQEAIDAVIMTKADTTFTNLLSSAEALQEKADTFFEQYLKMDGKEIKSIDQTTFKHILSGQDAWENLDKEAQKVVNKRIATTSYEAMLYQALNLKESTEEFVKNYLSDDQGHYQGAEFANYKTILSGSEQWDAFDEAQKIIVNDLIKDTKKTYQNFKEEATSIEKAINEFVPAYVTDETGTPYTTITADNFAKILSGTKDWSALSDVQRLAVNELLMSYDNGVSFETLKEAAIILKEHATQFVKPYQAIEKVNKDNYELILDGETAWNKLTKDEKTVANSMMKKSFDTLLQDASELKDTTEKFVKDHITDQETNEIFKDATLKNSMQILSGKQSWAAMNDDQKDIINHILNGNESLDYDTLCEHAEVFGKQIQAFINDYVTDENGVVSKVTAANYQMLLQGNSQWTSFDKDVQDAIDAAVKLQSKTTYTDLLSDANKFFGKVNTFIHENMQINEVYMKAADKDNYQMILDAEVIWNNLDDEVQLAINSKTTVENDGIVYETLLNQTKAAMEFLNNYLKDEKGNTYSEVIGSNFMKILDGETSWNQMLPGQQEMINANLTEHKGYEVLLKDAKDLEATAMEFVNAYTSDGHGVWYKEASIENYEQILSGIDNWNQLEQNDRDAVNELLNKHDCATYEILYNQAKAIKAELEQPIEPTDPVEPEVPVKPMDPVEPEVPVEPTDPVEPEVPVEPTDPVEPEVPVEPTDPIEPEVPVEPTVPETPVDDKDNVTVRHETTITHGSVQDNKGTVIQSTTKEVKTGDSTNTKSIVGLGIISLLAMGIACMRKRKINK